MGTSPEPTDREPEHVDEPPRVNPVPSAGDQRVRSEELFRGTRELLIEHAGEVYRLRLTRNGKLILHK